MDGKVNDQRMDVHLWTRKDSLLRQSHMRTLRSSLRKLSLLSLSLLMPTQQAWICGYNPPLYWFQQGGLSASAALVLSEVTEPTRFLRWVTQKNQIKSPFVQIPGPSELDVLWSHFDPSKYIRTSVRPSEVFLGPWTLWAGSWKTLQIFRPPRHPAVREFSPIDEAIEVQLSAEGEDPTDPYWAPDATRGAPAPTTRGAPGPTIGTKSY